MEKEFKFVGKNITEQDREGASALISGSQESAAEKQEQELEKNGEELEAIRLVNELLSNYLRNLNLPYEQLPAAEVHVYPYGTVPMREQSPGVKSRIDTQTKNIEIDRDPDPARFFKRLLHEAVHKVSHYKYSIEVGEERNKVNVYRAGYANVTRKNDPKTESSKVDFDELNEAVTEIIAQEIVYLNSEILAKKFGSNAEHIVAYAPLVSSLNKIIRTTSRALNRHPIETWDKIKRGYFTGEMMHLRDLEKVFGRGFLRFMADRMPDLDGNA